MINSNGFTRLSGLLSDEIDGLVRRVRPSLVVLQGSHFGAGAGIICRSDGLILTNNHVVGRHAPVALLDDNRQLETHLVARDAEIDLALLQIPAINLQAMPLVEANGLHVGESTFAFGHPWGQRGFVTSGIVSALSTAQTGGRRGAPSR
jgi:S1-C subfamily serine protease